MTQATSNNIPQEARLSCDRKQTGMVAERMFDKHRDRFMEAFYKET